MADQSTPTTAADVANANALVENVAQIRQALDADSDAVIAAIEAITAKFTSGLTVARLAPTLFASLPVSPAAGWLVYVTNSNTNTWGATIAGGGANKVLAFYNGTNWTVAAK